MNTFWHERSPDDALRAFAVDANRGLSDERVKKARAKYGKNVLPRGKRLTWWHLLIGQFINPMVMTLLVAALFTWWIAVQGAKSGSEENHYVDLYVILLAVIVNVCIGFWQEFRSSRIFEKLQELVKVFARVRREAKTYDVESTELVPGDIILLRQDTKVPADARLLTTQNLQVNESVLTGESAAVKKQLKAVGKDAALGDRKNMVYMGTMITEGESTAVVVATGAHTEIGRIASLTASVERESTPMQERLAHFGKILAIVILGISLVIFATGVIEEVQIGRGWFAAFSDMFTLTIAVIVAAIPEGLPAALSVVLAISAQRLLRRKGLVKTLIGAETLGSASMIVTDKTGTLTTGEMTVTHFVGVENKDRAALILALANEAFVEEGGDRAVRGDETDRAKMQFFLQRGGDIAKAYREHPRVAHIPFDQRGKYMASFHKRKDGSAELFVTGAPEILMEVSTLPPQQKKTMAAEIEKLAGGGFRLIGIAERAIEHTKGRIWSRFTKEMLKKEVRDLKFVGIAALRDPIREDVREALRVTREAGIRIVMATGDHQLTAVAIGKELGFHCGKDAILNGEEIEKLSDTEFRERVQKVHILSRVSPEHKMRLIQTLRDAGEVVAMTGDGVNDAPALKAADIGIALGSGNDVTKETADIVLMDNGFSVITEAIRQGRIAFDNIRKVTLFLMANSFTEMILVLSALVLRIDLPVTAVMILWANLVEDGFPNFALAFEPGEDDIMKRKPYSRNEPIMDKESLIITFIIGILSDIVLVGVFLYLYYFHLETYGLRYIQTLIFSMLATNSMIYVFSLKSLGKSIFHINFFNNVYLLFAVGVGFAFIIASVYWPLLQELLSTKALHPGAVAFALFMGLFQLLLIEIVKWRFYRENNTSLS